MSEISLTLENARKLIPRCHHPRVPADRRTFGFLVTGANPTPKAQGLNRGTSRPETEGGQARAREGEKRPRTGGGQGGKDRPNRTTHTREQPKPANTQNLYRKIL